MYYKARANSALNKTDMVLVSGGFFSEGEKNNRQQIYRKSFSQ